MKFTDLVPRVLTGIVFIAILLGSIMNEYAFLALFIIIDALALREFYKLIEVSKNVKINWLLNALGAVFLFLAFYFLFSTTFKPIIVFVPYIIYVLTLFISELYNKKEDPLVSLAYSFLGQFYIALPLALSTYLAFSYADGLYHYIYLLAMFVFIWVNDSFAYLFGSIFGKRRLFERISPKKSWEGFVGGALATVLVSFIFSHYFPNLPVWAWLGFALVVVIFGTWGDLSESLFKRTLGVKDSGNLLPGHGGILDRFDSMLFSLIALFVYLEIVVYLTC